MVRISKTFTLTKRQYHLGLEVKLERLNKTGKNLKFRYQLSGGHGLPIEGRWYTSTFRHALIARAEGNSIWRDNQDIREISKKLGGESVSPEEGKLIRYAGIAVQYFASVIVVDDDQDNRSFVTSARPTLEAYVVKVEHTGEPILPNADTLVIKDKKDRT